MELGNTIIPLTVAATVGYALSKGCNVFNLFMSGVKEGLHTVYGIAPAMFGIMMALGTFKASGALDMINAALAPAASLLGFPGEIIPLMILRPISGAGALAVFKDIISGCGPDSFAGRVASVMQGSTETTFYTITVYYAATRVKNTRHTLKAALAADAVGFLMSLLTVRLIFGR